MGVEPALPAEPGEGAGPGARHNQGAISANQRVLEIDPTGWGSERRPRLYSGNQRQAILDPREQQLCRRPGTLPSSVGPTAAWSEKRGSGLQLPQLRKGAFRQGSGCLQAEVHTLQPLGWAPTVCWVHA